MLRFSDRQPRVTLILEMKSRIRPIFFATLLVVLSAPAGASPPNLPRACLRNVLNALTVPDYHRTPEQLLLLKRYKNDPEFAQFIDNAAQLPREATSILKAFESRRAALPPLPRTALTVDLAKESVRTSQAPHCPACVLLPNHLGLGAFGLTEHDFRILSLRKGDSIRHGDKTVLLGEFVGAGNTTHIYEVAGQPDRVVRIPFDTLADQENARKFMKDYIDSAATIPADIPRAQILEVGPRGAYVIVERIHGTTDGRTFLESLPSRANPKTNPLSNPKANRALKARETRLRELVRKVMRWQHPKMDDYARAAYNSDTVNDEARQFLWDENRKDWILVDWER